MNTIRWINTFKYNVTPGSWKKVSDIILNKTVECGTGSLTVVALLRKNNIAARQVWGPIDAGRSFSPENFLKGHAWFEFYYPEVGWIPVEQFDISSIGFLPISYIRFFTNKEHIYGNTRLNNLIAIMYDTKYQDIVEYKRRIIED